MKRHILTACFCLLFPLLCSAQESMIAISASARSTGMSGHGIILTIENIETHQIYESKCLHAISDNAVIENIPAGLYEVCRIEIPFGDRRYWNESPEIRGLFGTIEILPNTNYFMGKYKSVHQGKMSHRQVLFSLEGQDMPEKLVKYIEKQGLAVEDFVPILPKEDSFVLAEFSELTNKAYIGGVGIAF